MFSMGPKDCSRNGLSLDNAPRGVRGYVVVAASHSNNFDAIVFASGYPASDDAPAPSTYVVISHFLDSTSIIQGLLAGTDDAKNG